MFLALHFESLVIPTTFKVAPQSLNIYASSTQLAVTFLDTSIYCCSSAFVVTYFLSAKTCVCAAVDISICYIVVLLPCICSVLIQLNVQQQKLLL